MSKKYYAVKKGRKTGIYTTWKETQKYVQGFSNAEYKSFQTKEEAEEFISENERKISLSDKNTIIAYTDGSYNKHTKHYSYGVVILKGNQIIAKLSDSDNDSKYSGSYQIAGECLGALNAMEWAINNDYKKLIIHYDYLGVEKWAKKEWRAKKTVSKDYVAKFDRLSQNIDVDFVKVKAHAGIEMNELADQLAKEALA